MRVAKIELFVDKILDDEDKRRMKRVSDQLHPLLEDYEKRIWHLENEVYPEKLELVNNFLDALIKKDHDKAIAVLEDKYDLLERFFNVTSFVMHLIKEEETPE